VENQYLMNTVQRLSEDSKLSSVGLITGWDGWLGRLMGGWEREIGWLGMKDGRLGKRDWLARNERWVAGKEGCVAEKEEYMAGKECWVAGKGMNA
jgi:hypothetical protein